MRAMFMRAGLTKLALRHGGAVAPAFSWGLAVRLGAVVALAFGVAFALFVTLLFVPAMYAVGADIARFYRWAWSGDKQAEFGHGASEDSDFGPTHDGGGKGGEAIPHPAE